MNDQVAKYTDHHDTNQTHKKSSRGFTPHLWFIHFSLNSDTKNVLHSHKFVKQQKKV